MKMLGSDSIMVNLLNDEDEMILSVFVTRNSTLEQRFEVFEFLAQEIKAAIEVENEKKKQEEIKQAEVKEEEKPEVATEEAVKE